MNPITESAAWAIATVLNQAGMDVRVENVSGRPMFTDCTGAQVIAAAHAVIAQGGSVSEQLADVDWLTVSFEERQVAGVGWGSAELVFAR